MKEKLKNLLGLRSLVTLAMTLILAGLIFVPNVNPAPEVLTLYCSLCSAVFTFYFTKKE